MLPLCALLQDQAVDPNVRIYAAGRLWSNWVRFPSCRCVIAPSKGRRIILFAILRPGCWRGWETLAVLPVKVPVLDGFDAQSDVGYAGGPYQNLARIRPANCWRYSFGNVARVLRKRMS